MRFYTFKTGRDNVFQWNGSNIYGPKRNGDGTITIIDADSGRVVWHGAPPICVSVSESVSVSVSESASVSASACVCVCVCVCVCMCVNTLTP
jgi:hypothetical protein